MKHPPPASLSDSLEYLSVVSPKDKPWDKNKANSLQLSALYEKSAYPQYSRRLQGCSNYLLFHKGAHPETKEERLKLVKASFCKFRHCIICQSRRAIMWYIRFLRALPEIEKAYPKARWIFLTLTVKNCPITELKATIQTMNAAWDKLQKRKDFPAMGWAKSVEVTRGQSDRQAAHPHFHILLMVPESYFVSRGYLSQKAWTDIWQRALKVGYTPVVHVKAVRPNPKREGNAIKAAILETFKYSVKPEDLIGKGLKQDIEWLEELTHQLHKTRAISIGGVLRQFMKETDPEDLLTENIDDENLDDMEEMLFSWLAMVKRYVRIRKKEE